MDARPGWTKRLWQKAVPPAADWKAALPALGLSFLSGLLIRLAYRPFDWSWLAFLALVPLFWGLRRCRPLMAFWVSMVFGTMHGFYALSWAHVVDRFNPLVYAGLPFAFLWWGLHLAVGFALIVFLARRLSPWMALLGAMLVFVAVEFFRSIGKLALPLGYLGHSIGGWPQLAQVASLAGILPLTALIIGTNLSLMEVIAAVRAGYGQVGAALRLGSMVALIVAGHLYGVFAIRATEQLYTSPDAFPFRVALIQTGIDQMEKYKSYSSEDENVRRQFQDKMFYSLMDQLRTIERDEVDVIITPESSMTNDFLDVEDHVQKQLFGGVILREVMDVATELDAPIMVGGVDNVFATEAGELTENLLEGLDPTTREFYSGNAVYGALWLIRPGEESVRPTADYRKIYLLPFGEAVPYLDIIPGFAENVVQVGTFARGEKPSPIGLMTGGEDYPREVRLGPSICFEDLFPGLHASHVANGAQLFVNTTNDAWFDGSAGPLWHHEMARWRSIEFRVPMVRCTNTGLTSVISPTGQVLEELPLITPAVLKPTVQLLPEPPRTLYSRIGNLFGWLSLLGAVALLLMARATRPEV